MFKPTSTQPSAARAARKHQPPMKVYALPEERRTVADSAARTGLSVSAYLLALGCGHQPSARVEQELIQSLIGIHAALAQATAALDDALLSEAEDLGSRWSSFHAAAQRVKETQAIVYRLTQRALGDVTSAPRPAASESPNTHDRQEGVDAIGPEVEFQRTAGLSRQRPG